MNEQAPGKRPATPSAQDGAGAGRKQRMLAAALLLACAGGIGYFALHEPVQAQARDDAANPSTQADTMAREPLSPRRAQARPAADDLASVVTPGQPAPTMGEVIEGLHKAGIHTGLGAFNPPGTSPPLVGLVVPDDYVLPEG